MYKIALKEHYDDLIIEKYIFIDKKVDFAGKTWLGFADFYDGFFEFLDSYTTSTLSTEYIHFSKVLISSLQEKT